MDILVSVAQLKSLLDEVPRLKRLASNLKNEELLAWDTEVKRIIRETFGTGSKEYARYSGIILLRQVETQEDKSQAFIDHISQREKALKEIIQNHDLPAEVEANDDGRGNIKAELESLHDGFTRYKDLVIVAMKRDLTTEQASELKTLGIQLQRRYGSLKEVIEKYGGPSTLRLQGGRYEYEAFSSVFNYTMFDRGAFIAVMDTALATLNVAIGRLGRLQRSGRLLPESVFANGKQYDAYEAIKDRIITATRELKIVDSWVNSDLFTLLSNVQSGVQIQILTTNMVSDFKLAGEKFKKQREQAQKGTLAVRKSDKFHDRFLVVDDKIFHLGASIKDAGNKLFAMTEVEGSDVREKLRDVISSYWDKAEIVI